MKPRPGRFDLSNLPFRAWLSPVVATAPLKHGPVASGVGWAILAFAVAQCTCLQSQQLSNCETKC